MVSLYCAALAAHLLFAGLTYALLAAMGGRAHTVSVGTPRLIRFRAGGVNVEIGALPLVAHVQIVGLLPGDEDDRPGSWRHLGLARRLAVLAAPWPLLLAIAALCLGPQRALGSFAHAPAQAVLPLDATPLVRGLLAVMAAGPFPVVLGVVCAKLAAFNLLPLPTLAGGRMLGELARSLRGRREEAEERPSALPTLVSMLLLLGAAVRLGWGVVHALW